MRRGQASPSRKVISPCRSPPCASFWARRRTAPIGSRRGAASSATGSPGRSSRSRCAPRDEPDSAAPSIAVLPFENLSQDVEQQHFADGLAEDIITRISRLRWLFVSARNSSLTFRGKALDVREIGRALGVRYVLNGSVRRSDQRLRIGAQLPTRRLGARSGPSATTSNLSTSLPFRTRSLAA